MKQNHIWAPKWPWVVGTVIGVYAIYILIALSGINPNQSMIALFFGGLGGAVGGVLGSIVMRFHEEDRHPTLMAVLIISGVAIGAVIGRAIAKGLLELVSPQFFVMSMAGLAFGAIFGLIPLIQMAPRNQRYGNICFWSTCILGLIGGAFLVIPGILLMTYFGRKKYTKVATLTGDR